jgi:hypothetical protein
MPTIILFWFHGVSVEQEEGDKIGRSLPRFSAWSDVLYVGIRKMGNTANQFDGD